MSRWTLDWWVCKEPCHIKYLGMYNQQGVDVSNLMALNLKKVAKWSDVRRQQWVDLIRRKIIKAMKAMILLKNWIKYTSSIGLTYGKFGYWNHPICFQNFELRAFFPIQTVSFWTKASHFFCFYNFYDLTSHVYFFFPPLSHLFRISFALSHLFLSSCNISRLKIYWRINRLLQKQKYSLFWSWTFFFSFSVKAMA